MQRANKIIEGFATSDRIVTREFIYGKVKGAVLFSADIADTESILRLLRNLEINSVRPDFLSTFEERLLSYPEAMIVESEDEILPQLLAGDTVMFIEGLKNAYLFSTRKWDKRAVTEPPTETVVNGPREGFVEDIKTNLSLIQRRLKTPALGIEKIQIGRVSSTTAAIVYISNIAKKEVINRIRARLAKIDIDAVLDTHNLEPYLDEKPYSIFRQSGVTEKPDVACAKLLEGRVIVILDGSPMVLTLPFLFIEDFHSGEDYYQRHSFTSFIRILRFAAIVLAIYLPALFVSVQIYNYDIIPLRLLVTLMDAVKGTPMRPMTEMLFVLLLFEVIREASVRMPRAVGTAMSIVGALILGETAVKAGILSSPSIMISALSSISLFLVPRQINSMALIRLIMTIIGGVLGIYGIMLSTIFIIHYLANIDAYGTPYLAPFAPLIPSDLKDAILLEPLPHLKTRPKSIPTTNETRQV